MSPGLCLNLFFTHSHKPGPNGGAEDGAQKRLQLFVEKEFEMPEMLLANNTEIQSNLISSFSTKKKIFILGHQTLRSVKRLRLIVAQMSAKWALLIL